MSVIVAIFMGLTISAEEILRDRKILKRESFLNLSRGSYLFAKIAVLLIISAIQTLTFVMIGNLILEVKDMNITFWLILFSCASFANLTGLNISSAFNSAVTIYILIPLLIIPQLLLSGIVIEFDKFNTKIASTEQVPWFGELIASRWAFEATLVDQFTKNKFDRIFYDYKKEISKADYIKLYYLPALETKLSSAFNHLSASDTGDVNYRNALLLLKTELGKQAYKAGRANYPYLNKLTPEEFDKDIFDSTTTFLTLLMDVQNIKSNKFRSKKDSLTQVLTSTPERKDKFYRSRSRYSNNSIEQIVTNSQEIKRIVESDGRLIQKIDPIYSTPDPRHPFDFKSSFYSPTKHFLGFYYDTLWFNLTVIWIMTLFLFIDLYFEWLRKIVIFIEKIASGRKFISSN
jgi:hypothetical protein